ncbi:MAG: HAD family phosphatase [Planctomycetaceae bacterium]
MPGPTNVPRTSIRAVVFDMDGLMLNTEDIFVLASDEMMQNRGREMSRECHQQMLGRRPLEAFATMASMLQLDETPAALLHESQQIFDRLLDAHLSTMPGLHALLEHIEIRQLPIGVATSSPRNHLQKLLGRFQLLDKFRVTLTAEDVQFGKPDPEIYLKAAGALQVAPSQMLVLEDSQAGTQAAAEAGAFTVSIPNTHTRCQDFSAAHLVAKHLNSPEVLALLDS